MNSPSFCQKTEPDTGKIVVGKIHVHLLNLVQENQYPVTLSIGAMTYADVPEKIEDIVTIL